METLPVSKGHERKLSTYVQDCRSLDLKEFRQRHGDAFLLHHGDLQAPQIGARIMVTTDTEATPTLLDRPFSPANDFLVFPVTFPQVDGTGTSFAWIGRMETNEVPIPHPTISEVHAFIRREADGTLSIQDSGSRNGTMVNGTLLPGHGIGSPISISSGSKLQLGGVRTTFLDAQALVTMVNRLYRF